jgi:hypothetical protein
MLHNLPNVGNLITTRRIETHLTLAASTLIKYFHKCLKKEIKFFFGEGLWIFKNIQIIEMKVLELN